MKAVALLPPCLDPLTARLFQTLTCRSPEDSATASPSWVIDAIVEAEQGAQRSLMHRYDAAGKLLATILEKDGGTGGETVATLAALTAWLR